MRTPGWHPPSIRLACCKCGLVIVAQRDDEYRCIRCHAVTEHTLAPPRNDPHPKRVALL